jgi:hypothetical protein
MTSMAKASKLPRVENNRLKTNKQLLRYAHRQIYLVEH